MTRTVITLVLSLLAASCGGEGDSAARTSPPSGETAAMKATPPGPPPADAHVVGPGACVECHAARVETFEKTTHFRTSSLPTPESLHGSFSAPDNEVATRNPDLRWRLTRDGDSWVESEVRPDGTRSERIDLVIGSGKLFAGFATWRDGGLFQLPVGWLTSHGAWNNCPGYEDGVANFDRALEPRCLDCHATWFDHRPGTLNQYDPETFHLGVTCERCHGPASAHVAWHEGHTGAEVGRHIVAPDRLTRVQRLEQCALCHGDPGELLRPAFSWVPGTPLADYVKQDSPDGGEAFVHTANQVQRLSLSACFIGSDTLECITCHDPHRHERDRMVDKARRECVGCHADKGCTEGPRLPAGVRDDCVACHMPKRSAIETTFSTRTEDYLDLIRMTEHRIGIHRNASDEHVVRWSREQPDRGRATVGPKVAQRLAERWDSEARALAEEREFLGAISILRRSRDLFPERTGTEPRLADALARQRKKERADSLSQESVAALAAGDVDAAHGKLLEATSVDEDHPAAWFNLGVTWERLGNAAKAEAAYAKSLALDSAQAACRNNLGALYAARDELDAAIEQFRQALIVDPGHRGALENFASALMRAGRPAEAVAPFERLRDLDPHDPAILAELGRCYGFLGRHADAATLLREASELSPEQADLLRDLGRSLTASRKLEEARRILEKALSLDPDDSSAHVALGELHLIGGHHDDAIRSFEEALNLDPRSRAAHLDLAWVLIHHAAPARRDPVRAVRLAETVRKAGRLDAETKRKLTVIYTRANRLDLAALL